MEHAHDPEADVEPDEVGQLERAHRVVEADPRARVDVLGRAEALLVGPHRLGEERHEDAVDDEARPVGRDDDLLAELGRRGRGSAASVASVGRRAADELDQRHDRHRAEEVHADEARPALAATTASASRSIAIELVFVAKIAAGGATPSSSRHSARLDVDVLEDRLDDEVGVGGASPRSSVATMRPRVASRSSAVELALGDGPLEVAGDPVAAGVGAREVGLVERDLLADRRVDLGDPVAHQAGAGDEDPLDRHRVERSRRRRSTVERAIARRAASSTPRTATTAADARNAPP